MHALKIITANHANASCKKCVLKYIETELKLLNCNSIIYFNKILLEQNLTPKYAQKKVKRISVCIKRYKVLKNLFYKYKNTKFCNMVPIQYFMSFILYRLMTSL
jgi:hypothetical protein